MQRREYLREAKREAQCLDISLDIEKTSDFGLINEKRKKRNTVFPIEGNVEESAFQHTCLFYTGEILVKTRYSHA